MTSGALTYARLSNLPEGILLRTEGLVIYDKDITVQIAKAPVEMREKLKKNAFYLLEQIATYKVLLLTAKAEANKSDEGISKLNDQQIIQACLKSLVSKVKVSDKEIEDFYNSNKTTFGGAVLNQVRDQIRQYLLQGKQQKVIEWHIQNLGQRMLIEVSMPWVKVHAALARDNPVGKARASGRPSLIDFGSTGCVPCDMMAPVLDRLKEKYKDKLNVLFIHVGEEQILTNRYGIQSIPVQVFFDKTGKEVFRHVGFFSQEEIEEKLSQMGVK